MKALRKKRATKKAAVLRISLALSLAMGLVPLSVASAEEMPGIDVLQPEATVSTIGEIDEEVEAQGAENPTGSETLPPIKEIPNEETEASTLEDASAFEENEQAPELQRDDDLRDEQSALQLSSPDTASIEDSAESAESQAVVETAEGISPVETFSLAAQEDDVSAESVAAPYSSKQLESGSYTVTANIYVPSDINPVLPINAFVTNPANPSVTGTIPRNPVYQNARLVVSESGEATLSVDIVNDVFTVQSMASGSNVEIVGTQRNDVTYGRPNLDKASWTGRITHLDLRLLDWTGLYNFGACEERATLLIADFDVPLRLAVDLSNARKDYAGGSFSQTYTDSETGISLDVSCDDNPALVNKLADAKLQAKNVTDDAGYQSDLARAKDSFSSCGDVSLYDIELVSNGEKVDLTEAGAVVFRAPASEGASLLQVTKNNVSVISGTREVDSYKATLFGEERALGTFAVAYNVEEWAIGPKLVWSDGLGASITLMSTGICPNNDPSCGCAMAQMLEPKGIGARLEAGAFFDLACSQQDKYGEDFMDPRIESVYTLAQYSDLFGLMITPSERHFGNAQTILSASLPASSSSASVYLLEGTSQEILSVSKVDSLFKNGCVYFDMVDRNSEELKNNWNDPNGLLAEQFNAAYGKAFDPDTTGLRELTDSDSIAFFVVVSETPKSIEKPVAATGLVFNGAEQVGVPGGEGYNVTLQGSATEPGNYTALVTLKDGYVWSDGTTAPVMISWSIAEAPKPVEPVPTPSDKLAPGTYTVTANLFVPGSVNDLIPGVTAYMTNPKNPLVAASDPNYGLPISPMADNAKLVVTTDGRYLLDLSLPNPAFTLIDFGTASGGAKVLGVQRDGKAYGANAFGRITRAVIEVPADKTFSTVFASSHVYAAPLQMDKYWNVTLNVDATSAKKMSDSTAIDIPGSNPGSGSGNNGGSGNSGNAGGNGAGGNGSTGGNGGNVTVPGVTVPGSNGAANAGSTTVTGNNGALSGMVAGSAAAASATKLTQGTYTVTCNIWFDKETTGLPLNPHITSGVFPPKDPVSNNAKLRVDANGRCTVTVPISIQHKVMKVNSISGLSVVDSASADGALSSITVDLGVLSPRDTVVRKSCTVGITMGDLAGTISGITGSKSWPATFQLNFAGVPASGGGTIPAAALAAMAGSDGVSDTQDAANAALAALADDTVTADGSPVATAVNEDGTPLASGMGSEAGLAADRFSPEALERELAANPWMAFVLGVLCTLAVGAAAWGGRRYYLTRAEARESAEVQA